MTRFGGGIMIDTTSRAPSHALRISLPYLVSLYPTPALPPIPRPSSSNSSTFSINSSNNRRLRKVTRSRSRDDPFVQSSPKIRDTEEECQCPMCDSGEIRNDSEFLEKEVGNGLRKRSSVDDKTLVKVVEASLRSTPESLYDSSKDRRPWIMVDRENDGFEGEFSPGYDGSRTTERDIRKGPLFPPYQPIAFHPLPIQSTPFQTTSSSIDNLKTPPLSPSSHIESPLFSRRTSKADINLDQNPLKSKILLPSSLGSEEEPIKGRPGYALLQILLEPGKGCWSPPDLEEVGEIGESGEWDWRARKGSYEPRVLANVSQSIKKSHKDGSRFKYSRANFIKTQPIINHPLEVTLIPKGLSIITPPKTRYQSPPSPFPETFIKNPPFHISLPEELSIKISVPLLFLTTFNLPLTSIRPTLKSPIPTKPRSTPISPLAPAKVISKGIPITSTTPPVRPIFKSRTGVKIVSEKNTELRVQVLEWSMVKSGKLCGIRSRVSSGVGGIRGAEVKVFT